MKIFRWQGLVVFILLAATLWGFSFFILDGLIKEAIEDEGSEAAETEIGVASLSTSLLSQSLNINKLQVANPDDLSQNAFQADVIKVNLNAEKALQRKIVIDDMTVEGIRFNQKRSQPAKPYREVKTKTETAPAGEAGGKQEAGGLSFLDKVDIKSPQEILQNENLKTLEAAGKIRQQLQDIQTRWEEKIKKELDPQVLKDMQDKIAGLQEKAKNLSLQEAQSLVQDFQDTKKEIEATLAKIPNLKKDLQNELSAAKTMAAELKDLPRQDFDYLKNKYSLDLEGGGNLVGNLIGGQVKVYLDKAWYYYRLLSPYLNKGGSSGTPEETEYVRGKGVFVKFAQAVPYPDFLIKHGKLSMNILDTPIQGELNNLSDNQKALGQPATLNFESGKTDRFEHFSLQAAVERTQAVADDSLSTGVKVFRLKNIVFDDGVQLQEGTGQLTGALKIVGENKISGDIEVNLSEISLLLPEKEGNEIYNSITRTLSSVKQFSIKVQVAGTMNAYTIDVQSDLNDILSNAVKQVAAEQIKKFEGSLKLAVNAKVKDALSGVDGSLAGLLDMDNVLSQNESSWTGLLEQAKEGGLSSVKKKLPGDLGDKLKDFKLPF